MIHDQRAFYIQTSRLFLHFYGNVSAQYRETSRFLSYRLHGVRDYGFHSLQSIWTKPRATLPRCLSVPWTSYPLSFSSYFTRQNTPHTFSVCLLAPEIRLDGNTAPHAIIQWIRWGQRSELQFLNIYSMYLCSIYNPEVCKTQHKTRQHPSHVPAQYPSPSASSCDIYHLISKNSVRCWGFSCVKDTKSASKSGQNLIRLQCDDSCLAS